LRVVVGAEQLGVALLLSGVALGQLAVELLDAAAGVLDELARERERADRVVAAGLEDHVQALEQLDVLALAALDQAIEAADRTGQGLELIDDATEDLVDPLDRALLLIARA